jgi:hypothetical protein
MEIGFESSGIFQSFFEVHPSFSGREFHYLFFWYIDCNFQRHNSFKFFFKEKNVLIQCFLGMSSIKLPDVFILKAPIVLIKKKI